VHVAISLCDRFSHDPRSISTHVFSLSFSSGQLGPPPFWRGQPWLFGTFFSWLCRQFPIAQTLAMDPSQIVLALCGGPHDEQVVVQLVNAISSFFIFPPFGRCQPTESLYF
jgi:hypothetical protein